MNLHLALVLVAVSPAAALAQQEAPSAAQAPQPAEHPSVPELDGHLFAPSLLVETPFRMTTFKLGLLYGAGKATGPHYDLNGNVDGQAEYTFGALAQTFRFEYRFLEWLSAGLLVTTSLYTGIDGPSVVSVGSQVGIGAGVRVKAGHRFGPVETAVIFDASSQPQYGILVAAAIIRAIQDRVVDASAALQSTHVGTLNPSLAASWAPWPAFGLTGNAGYVFKSLYLSGTKIADQSGLQFAIAGDFDFAKVSSVPIALLAAYRLTAPLGSDGVDRIDDITGGIFYTGRRELGLGLEVGWRSFTIRPPLDSRGVLAQLGLQYYW